MAKLTVEFEFDEVDLGHHWFNVDNLEACLYSEQHTRRELLTITKAVGVDGEQHSVAIEARCRTADQAEEDEAAEDDNLDAHPGFY